MISLPFLAVMVIISIGLSAVIFRRNLIKIVMGTSIVASAINLFIVSLGYREGGVAPIFTGTQTLEMVLPTPQALTLTSIVIDLAVTAMMLSFAIIIYKHYGSLDSRKRRLRE
jgi:multicomponent Na+:H+ antiporter subunit C